MWSDCGGFQVVLDGVARQQQNVLLLCVFPSFTLRSTSHHMMKCEGIVKK